MRRIYYQVRFASASKGWFMAGRLEGKVAVVTGSSSGIGQAIAVRFANEGADVLVNFHSDADGANHTKAEIQKAGRRAHVVQADVAKVPEAQRLIDEAYSALGGCHVLVNNAGVEKGADFWDVTEKDYDLVMDLNVKGVFFTSQSFVRRLRDSKQPGRILNLSSVHEDLVFPHFDSYAASKGALRMLMRNLAVELGPLGITVNNIAPGAIITPINAKLLDNKAKLDPLLANIPVGRMGNSDEVASLAAFLASDEAAYITGSTYVIDGGLMRNYHEQ